MRYAVIAKSITLAQAEAEAVKVGAKGIRKARVLNQLFCELDKSQAEKLSGVLGLRVKPLKEFRVDQVTTQMPPAETFSDVFYLLRSYFTPALTGSGLTVAVLDSGVRKSHQSLETKVVHEANFSDSPTAGDVFGHGTQVAFCVCGGAHGLGERAGASPGACVMNIKVINDDGVGTDENIVMGVDEVCELAERARKSGLYPTDDTYPNLINLSLGAPDDGDPDNPVRVACRQAITDYGLEVIAAAGNYGPKMTTVTIPGCDPEVVAVGAILTLGELEIWEKSSRGPTAQGETKPDFVIWGTDMEMASEKVDDEYVTKSGTSFAAPLLSGLTGLLWESGRRAYGEAWYFSWRQAREFAPYFSSKPTDAPVKKDNAYGYGLPAMGSMLGAVAPTRRPEQEMIETFPMVMMMGMIARMAGGMV